MQFGQQNVRMNPQGLSLGGQRIQNDPFGYVPGGAQMSAIEETICKIHYKSFYHFLRNSNELSSRKFDKNYAINQLNSAYDKIKELLTNYRVGDVSNSWVSLESIKDYYDVNNSYVLQKLRLILFPVTTKSEQWKRQVGGYDFNNQEQPPREDVQAPDIYIPIMSFITFILITVFYLGNTSGFDPKVLGYTYTKSMFLWLFETTIQKGCFYFLSLGNPSFFELLCYSGYKFVNLVIIVITQLTLGYIASYVAFRLTSIMFFVFFYQTMNRFSSGNTLADHIKDGSSLNKKSFMLINSVVQILMIWILSYN